MTPRLSVIASAIRRVISGVANSLDPYWDKVVALIHGDSNIDKDDPYYNHVALLIHGNGTNGSTVITDQKGKTVTANGNAQISTAQSKFGGASAYFDGTGDYLSVASSADFGFGTGDFTIECWVKTAGTNKSVWDNRITNEAGTGYIATTTGRIGFWNSAAAFEGTTNVADDTWHHLAWCRASGPRPEVA